MLDVLYVCLFTNDDNKILAYINKFLTAATLPVERRQILPADMKLCSP